MMNFLKDWIIQYQNKFSVGGVETTIDRITGTVSQEGDTIMASYLNEIQKNCIYQVNATRVIEGVLEIYDISIDGSEDFTPFNQTFLIDFGSTNTQVDSLLRFNGITYSLRFSDSVTNGDKAPSVGFIPKRAVVKLDVSNSKAIIVSSLKFSEETINFTSATGSVTIPSGLPIGTKKLIRKVNSTQGAVTISCAGETFTPSALSYIVLNSDGDFWLVEKINNTRWDLVDGKESGININGSYIRFKDGTQEFRAKRITGKLTITGDTGKYFVSANTYYPYPASIINATDDIDLIHCNHTELFLFIVAVAGINSGWSFRVASASSATTNVDLDLYSKKRWY